jgi:hypothetical protein
MLLSSTFVNYGRKKFYDIDQLLEELEIHVLAGQGHEGGVVVVAETLGIPQA